MMRRSGPLLALLVATSLFAQRPVTHKATGSIAGRVVKFGTDEPIRKARVTVDVPQNDEGDAGTPGRSALTDDLGDFVLTNIPAGNYRIAVEHNGFTQKHPGRGATVTLTEGEQLRGLILRLLPSAAITGQVVNEDGEPMANITIAVLQPQYQMGRRLLVPVQTFSTNDLGEYRAFGLPPGKYYVRAGGTAPSAGEVIFSPSSDGSTKNDQAYAPLYYPNVRAQESATPIVLRGGDEFRANFALLPTHTYSVSGTVLGMPTGKGDEAAAMVMVVPRDLEDMTTAAPAVARLEPGGRFTVPRILPGQYTVMVVSQGEGQFVGSANIEVAEGNVAGLQVVMRPLEQTTIHGFLKVQSASGPVPSLDSLRLAFQPTKLTDDPMGMVGSGQYGGVAQVQKDGRFAAQVFGAGAFQTLLEGGGFEDYYTKSVLYGGREVMDSGFHIVPGAQMEVIVAGDGARVEGTVLGPDKKPMSDITVIAIPEEKLRGRNELYQPTTTDSQGHFVMRGLRPGDYTLFAWDDLEGTPYMDPDFMKHFESQGEPLHAEAKGRYTFTLKALSADLDTAAPPAQ